MLRLSSILCLIPPALLAGGLEYICNSAPEAGVRALVHADISSFQDTDFNGWFLYSVDAQSSWTKRGMSRVRTPGYDSTWQGDFLAPDSGMVYYYVQAGDGPHRATQSPHNSADDWPPGQNLLAESCEEPPGDAFNNPEGAWLDLTGAWLGYSNSHFYFMLTNNHDSWPTSGGVLKWYSYSFGFANPDAPSDSWVFAPVYVDAWPVMRHGLFAINRYSSDIPERIADIDYATRNNRLYMRCRISDMVNDYRFGPWPGSGWLAAAANSQTINVSGATLKDTTATCAYYGHTQQPVVNRNTAPVLMDGEVSPDSGDVGTEFVFSVRYIDADTNLPVTRTAIIDTGDTLDLVPDGHDYGNGVLFRSSRGGFGGGWHRFSFRFDDGMASVGTTLDSFYVRAGGCEEVAATSPLHPIPGMVGNVLRLPDTAARYSTYTLLNSVGREIMTLFPGANDVRHLSSGVYFCRQTASSARQSAFRASEAHILNSSLVVKVVVPQ